MSRLPGADHRCGPAPDLRRTPPKLCDRSVDQQRGDSTRHPGRYQVLLERGEVGRRVIEPPVALSQVLGPDKSGDLGVVTQPWAEVCDPAVFVAVALGAHLREQDRLLGHVIAGLGRIAGEKSLGALTNTLESDPDTEIQKQAVMAIGRHPRDEAVPLLIRIARSHPKMPVRKQAIQLLSQTGDERAVALFTELLSK